MARGNRDDGRKFAPPPPGVVRVRLEGQSGAALVALLAALPEVKVLSGPDSYVGDRLYLMVSVSEEKEDGSD